MPLVIPDEVLQAAKLNERDACVEISCRLFEAGKLTKAAAAKWAGLSRVEFEKELLARNIPLHRFSLEDLKTELESLESLKTRG